MKFSDLFTTPKGRRATGKLAADLLKITGKVAVAGTAGFAGALVNVAEAAVEVEPEKDPGWKDGAEGYGYYKSHVAGEYKDYD